MAKKYQPNLYQIKWFFSGPLFLKKRGYSLVDLLHNSSCIKNENFIFAKNAIMVGSKVPKCDH